MDRFEILALPFPDSEQNGASLTNASIHCMLDESGKNVSDTKSLKSFKLSCQSHSSDFSRNNTISSLVIDRMESENAKNYFCFKYPLLAFDTKKDIR